MSKLYKVKAEIEMMVMAEDPQAAINEAYQHVFKELEEYGMYIPTEIKYKSEVPENWKGSIPYAGTKPCTELISGMPADAPVEEPPPPPPKPTQLERPPAQVNPALDFGSFVGRPTKKRTDSGIVDNK
ncbi:MAG: hypothetical protein ACW97P_10145 [Candidatus Hodarchaeales archaeon]|jgi:hypothetical protein